MRIHARALALTFGLFWGGAIFCVAFMNLFWPSYGRPFL